MPVTEIAILNLIPPHEYDSSILHPILRLLSERQSAWSGYLLYFFQNTSKPEEVYLVSGWKDVPAHNAWIASDGNQELLALLKQYLTVASLLHLDVDFAEFPKDVQGLRVIVGKVGECSEDTDGDKVVWKVEGRDAEGKEEGVWHLFGYGEGFSDSGEDKPDAPLLKKVEI